MAQATTSLRRRRSELADPGVQLTVLNTPSVFSGKTADFAGTLRTHGLLPLATTRIDVLQVNLGKMCNQACTHCHVDAGPDRIEMMSAEVLNSCLQAVDTLGVRTVDITGGAPEMHPDFRWFVDELVGRGVDVMVRCNLTIIVANPKYHDLPSFYAERRVHVVSSLPCYTEENVDRQRGAGAFEDSIAALKLLNTAGYGDPSTGLKLDLVYNPGGASLPGPQSSLRADYARILHEEHGIIFNDLHCMTNMPIARFLEDLIQSGRYAEYMDLLVGTFNAASVDRLMCRNTLSVGWDGMLHDCDFNQMLELTVSGPTRHIRDAASLLTEGRPIVTAQHCYGCTAGAGSSCGGQLA
jgi:radical SAM/Cys-rich protein